MRFKHPDGSITDDLPYFPYMGQYESLINEGFEPIENEAALDSPNITPANDDERCHGITAKGERCHKKAIEGSEFCSAHKPADEPAAPAGDEDDLGTPDGKPAEEAGDDSTTTDSE